MSDAAAHAPAGSPGFTLLELVLAVAIAALVAASVLGTLNLFVEADTRAVGAAELSIEVERSLQLVRRDVATATTLDLQADQLQLQYANGSAVVYALPAGGTELHRFAASSLASLTLTVQTLLLGGAVVPQYDGRGHLRDSTYRASAVLQGVTAITATAIRASLDNQPIGVTLRITHAGDSGAVVTGGAAVSLPLSENHAVR